MRFRMLFAACAVALALAFDISHAAVPGLISLQGILTDSSGNPMPNTGYGVTFRIYTAATGGTVLWTEETAVYTLDGLFTAVLGTQTPVPDTAFNNPDRWLGIQMDDYPEMTPRSRLTSVAYANQTAQWNSDGQDLYRLNGNIGIGTNSPSRAFTSPTALSLSSSGGEGLIEIIRTGPLVDGMAIGQYDWTNDDNDTFDKQSLAIRGDVSGSVAGNRGAAMAFFTKADGGAIFERLRITNTGKIGINTSTPESRLHVLQGSAGAVTAYSESIASLESNTPGYLSILTPNGLARGILFGQPSNAIAGGLIYNNSATPNGFQFRVNGNVTTTVIDAQGDVGLGVTDPFRILQVVQNSDSKPIADQWDVYSSRRWKTNIETIHDAMSQVAALRGVTYDEKATGEHRIGLIAEEVGEVIPEVVTYESNGVDAQSVDYARLVALLIEGMKEQQKQIDELKSRLDRQTP